MNRREFITLVDEQQQRGCYDSLIVTIHNSSGLNLGMSVNNSI